MKILRIGTFLFLLMGGTLTGAEPEPNWRQRYEVFRQEEMRQFAAPTVGQTVTLQPRIGRDQTGRITAITTNTVTIDGKTLTDRQLTSKCCDRIFAHYHAARVARAKVRQERDNYLARKTAVEDAAIREGTMPENSPKETPVATQQETEGKASEDQLSVAPKIHVSSEPTSESNTTQNKTVLVIITVAIIALMIAGLARGMRKKVICPNCGHLGFPQSRSKGSCLIEVILLCFLIIPGLIYSIWRMGAKHQVCPRCGAGNMVPLDTPKGRELQAKYHG